MEEASYAMRTNAGRGFALCVACEQGLRCVAPAKGLAQSAVVELSSFQRRCRSTAR
jgi:hypothetical protein